MEERRTPKGSGRGCRWRTAYHGLRVLLPMLILASSVHVLPALESP